MRRDPAILNSNTESKGTPSPSIPAQNCRSAPEGTQRTPSGAGRGKYMTPFQVSATHSTPITTRKAPIASTEAPEWMKEAPRWSERPTGPYTPHLVCKDPYSASNALPEGDK